MSSQRVGKYACLEIEARYLLRRLPDGWTPSAGWQITDRYLLNTRLRLRRMQPLSGGEPVFKLTQKYRDPAQSPYETVITNIYLTEAEYRRFDGLEASLLRKTRYPYPLPPDTLSLDIFEGRHSGLILAEMEWDDPSLARAWSPPPFILADVTADPFFTGGSLAALPDDAFRLGLAQRLGPPLGSG